MKPGVYDISDKEYHGGEGISRSGIMKFRKSPKHFWNKYIKGVPDKETNDKLLGKVLHALILEPHIFEKNYYIMPKIDRRTSVGKKQYDEIKEGIGGCKYIIDQDLYDQALDMEKSLKSSDDVTQKLLMNAEYEKSIYWIDEETGVICKCRPDIWHSKLNVVVDIKTVRDGSSCNFYWDVKKLGYHIQAAMIQDGILSTTGQKIDNFYYLVIEKEEPYAIAVYELGNDWIEKGRQEYQETLKKYKECMETNVWPSYEIKVITLNNNQATI